MDQAHTADRETLQIENAMLAELLEASEAELATARNGAAPLVPDEVSALVEELLEGLGSALPGMSLRDGELRLRVGAHEISARFDRSSKQPRT